VSDETQRFFYLKWVNGVWWKWRSILFCPAAKVVVFVRHCLYCFPCTPRDVKLGAVCRTAIRRKWGEDNVVGCRFEHRNQVSVSCYQKRIVCEGVVCY
jgi:hypothetical protein